MLSAPAFIGPVEEPSVHVMTQNVRRRMPRAWPGPRNDRWSVRRPLLARLLQAERPAILGLQEVLSDQSDDIREMLGSGYASTGSGREADRSGERCELHVDSTRFRIRDTATSWLSSTPDRPGSRSFGNGFPRIVVHAELDDLVTGQSVHAFVTHFDHLSARSRTSSAHLLADLVRRVSGPVVVLGDFNTDSGSRSHETLVREGGLVDTLDAPATRLNAGVVGTYSHYRAPRRAERRLDWILVDRSATVERAGINPVRFDGLAVSDHDAVQAVVRWPGAVS